MKKESILKIKHSLVNHQMLAKQRKSREIILYTFADTDTVKCWLSMFNFDWNEKLLSVSSFETIQNDHSGRAANE